MSIEEKIYSRLSTNAALLALVPASRIKPPGDWQNMPRPYIVHFPVSLITTYVHGGGLQPLRIWDFYQISSFGDDYSSASAVATAVRNALASGLIDDVNIFWRSQRAMPYEHDMRVQQIVQEWKVCEALT